MLSPLDLQRLRDALCQAENAIGLSDPNPRVGCVIGHRDGRVLGVGHSQQAGGPHAEVMALRAAAAHGASGVSGATAWVTLEPCCHHGRTPPCTDALIAAGIAKVVIALRDPYPAVDGQGIEQLRRAGIEVVVAELDPAPEAQALVTAATELNIGFLHRVRTGRPWVRAKMATSMDGRAALPDGRSQWITSEAARADGHAWRARAGTVLTGIGSVLADDPRMDVRGRAIRRQPPRVVLDSDARLPASARLLHVEGGSDVTVFTRPGATPLNPWQRRDGGLVHHRTLPVGPSGGLDLPTLVRLLGDEHVNELHVEAGPTLSGAFRDAGLVDEWLIYLAPRLLGQGRNALASMGEEALSDPPPWRIQDSAPVGNDLRVRLRRR